MPVRFRLTHLVAGLVALGGLGACAVPDATAPAGSAAAGTAARPAFGLDPSQLHDGKMIPGSGGSAGSANASTGNRLACNVPSTLVDSAIIGPAGGELDIGPHRLIIPAGALTKDTLIKGVIPAGSSIEIDFYPQGLHFKKPAGLIFDVSTCGAVPGAVYLDEIEGNPPEDIPATFSEWWHTIAVPLDHFSSYFIAV